MSEPLKIVLEIDRTSARASMKQFEAEMKGVGKRISASMQAAYASELSSFKSTNSQKAKAAASLADSQIRLARRILDNEMANISTAKRARTAANDQAIREARKFGEVIRGLGANGAAAFKTLNGSTQSLTSSLVSLAATALTVHSLVGYANAIQGAMASANAETEKQLEKLRETKALIREIVAISGSKEGASDAEVQKHLGIRKASGMTPEEAKAFALEYRGAGQAAIGTNISEKEAKRAEPMLARLAKTKGDGSEMAGVVGKLGGLLAGIGETKTAEELLRKTTTAMEALSEGVGDNPTLVKQQAQVMSSYIKEDGKGLFKDAGELGAVVAAASRINPETSAETLKSTTRVLRGFSSPWSGLLSRAGITEKDGYVESSDKLFKHLEGVEASGRAVDAYLGEEGVSEAGTTHIQAMYNQRAMTARTVAKFKAPETEEQKAAQNKQAIAKIDNQYMSDNTLRVGQKQAAKDEAQLHNSMNLQYAKELELEAEANLEKQGMGESSGAAQIEDQEIGLRNTFRGATLPPGVTAQQLGRKIRVDDEMARLATERGFKVPGRPDASDGQLSKLGGPLTALGSVSGRSNAYLGWLNSGGNVGSYSAVGSEMELAAREDKEQVSPDGSVKVPPPKEGERRLGQDPNADKATIEILNRIHGTLEKMAQPNAPKPPFGEKNKQRR